jgi:hypothetical protein
MTVALSTVFTLFGLMLMLSSLSIVIRNKDILSLPVFISNPPKTLLKKYQFYTQFLLGVVLLMFAFMLINIDIFTPYIALISAAAAIVFTLTISHIKFLIL